MRQEQRRPPPPRDTSVTLRTAKVSPPPAANPANRSAPAGAGRDIQINPTEKLLLETSRGGGGARRAGPAPEPMARGGGAPLARGDAPALSAPPAGVASRDMLTSRVYKKSADAPSQHSAEVPAGCDLMGCDVRPVLFFPSYPQQPPRAPEEVSPRPFPRELTGSHDELPEKRLRQRQAGLAAHRP